MNACHSHRLGEAFVLAFQGYDADHNSIQLLLFL
jgi:hypothetical protein